MPKSPSHLGMLTPSHRNSRRSHTTFAGRIVYDRPKHEFSVADVSRVMRKIQIESIDPEKLLELVPSVFAFLLRVYRAALQNSTIAPWLPIRIVSQVGQFLLDLLADLAMFAGDLASALRGALRQIAGPK